MLHRSKLVSALALGSLSLAFAPPAAAQYAERSALLGSGERGVDCSGRSIKNPRVRAIHEADPTRRGGTAFFFEYDPFLAYQLGRNLNFREFRERDGIFDASISGFKGPMPDGTTSKITANNQVSCLGCHNLPSGNPGGGANFSKDSGHGRNSPHYFGAGIMEMLAIQVRTEMLLAIDTDANGWVSAAEAQAAPASLLVPTGSGANLDYGDPRLSNGATGSPSLNNIFNVWYVDAQGARVPGATEVDGQTTFGYTFAMVVWGFGQGPGRSALNPTNRAFLWDPWAAHGGLDSHDPSTLDDPDGDGVSAPTLAGAVQFPATHRAPDAGAQLDPLGFSRDDPDGDGFLTEISEGDLDLAEWFMLNAPRPAFAGTPAKYARGVGILTSMGCAECHTPSWTIRAADSDFAGDRRFFDLDVAWNAQTERLEGEVVPLYTKQARRYLRHFGAFTVEGLFTDLRHHDMGERFEEIDFGGNKNRLWRTSPLWGVGSSWPYGHDGQSLTLEDAILRHGGEGAAARAAYVGASESDRAELLSFLSSLRLYDIETLPTDVDGDGQIASNFMVAGMDTGRERFNPEWLFRSPVKIQGLVTNTDGVVVRSFAATNLVDAYGLDLPLRRDTDLDGWPDVWDHAPGQVGYQDGVH